MTALKAFATMVDLAGSCPMVHQPAHVQMELTGRDANFSKVNTNQWVVIKIYPTVKIKWERYCSIIEQFSEFLWFFIPLCFLKTKLGIGWWVSHIKVIAMISATKITLALYVMNHRLGTSIYKRPKGSIFPKETNVEVGIVGTMDKALVSVRNLIVV